MSNRASLCAPRVHSYQVSNCLGNSIGGRHAGEVPKKEHTHINKINLVIDNLLRKSYILVQMKGTQHD